jgi:UDP-GlcNAc:undecaprenyl-phosphate GlcNAc-1-phosphate transferase|tara:strand:+ start:220 stop:1251 length:1032 start_codon:yes stop_codon:yes gene_type:complete
LSFFQLPILYAVTLAFIISIFLNRVVIGFARNYKKNNKNEKRLSNKNIPPYGGVATSFAFFIATIFLGRAEPAFITIGICALIISIIGIIDDKYTLGWKTKLIFQILIILYPLIALDIFINIEAFLNLDIQNFLNIVISLIWVLVITNSINFIDNMDGLTVFVSGSICLQIALLANYSDIYKVTDISLLLLATLFGFLIFNYPPARLYFGDSGTLFVGYVLGFISIIFDWSPPGDGILISPLSPVLFVFVVPILDFTVVITHRIRNNISPTQGGTDHISHRLLNTGYSEKKVLLEFLLLGFIFYGLLIGTISFNGFLSYLFASSYLLFFIFSFLRYRKLEPLS